MRISGVIKIERTINRKVTDREKTLIKLSLESKLESAADQILYSLDLPFEYDKTEIEVKFSEDENGR